MHWSFEDGSLSGWQATGALGALVSRRANFANHPQIAFNKEGTGFLSTLDATDGALNDGFTGVVESPRFVVSSPTASLLVGGGRGAGVYVAACAVDDSSPDGCKELARVQGNNDETLQYRTIDLSSAIGKSVFFKVVDSETGSWGHVTVDDVRANAPAMPRGLKVTRDASGVNVSWDLLPSAQASGYNVYRSTQQTQGFEKLTAVPVSTGHYRDPTAVSDTAYFYQVSAVGSDGAESESNVTYTRRFRDLTARGDTVTYAGSTLTGIEFPVGPIGAGGILHFGDGSRNESWIFNVDDAFRGRRDNWVPNSFFAVRASASGGGAQVRALQTTAVGPFPAAAALTFQGEYPLATYAFSDPALPVQVTEQVTSPLIPGDLKRSAVPTAIYTFTFKNPGNAPVDIALLAAQQNAVGFSGTGSIGGPGLDSFEGYGANANGVTIAANTATVQMTGAADAGSMALSLLPDSAAATLTGTASWASLDALYQDFSDDGAITGPSSASSPGAQTTVDAAMASRVTVAPGATVQLRVVLSWYFPKAPRGFGGDGMQYTNFWSSAADVDSYVRGNLTSLLGDTHLFHETFYDSTLPQYVLDRATAALAVLHTPTAFWAKNGFFGGWEGYGCCDNMPNHVWHYAQGQARVWPEIGRMWTSQWLDAELPSGLLPYRYSNNTLAFDGQAGVILGAYRDYLASGDDAWVKKYWPKVRGAMEYLVTQHDPGLDGHLQGQALTTLDKMQPTLTPWLGTMYLAAVHASARLATVAGDDASAGRYDALYAKGQVTQEALLWNGSYYVERADPGSADVQEGDAVDISMLLGQWWSGQLGLGDIYDSDHMTQALQNLYSFNHRDNNLGTTPFDSWWYQQPSSEIDTGHLRDFVEPTDGSLTMFTWPQGNPPANHIWYSTEAQSGYEHAAAAVMLQRGLVQQGLQVISDIADRYDGRLRNAPYLWFGGCGIGDGSGNPFGEDECGKWYGRSLATWSELLALQGFSYDAAAKQIGFAPRLTPENHRSFFSAGNAWGTFAQKIGEGTQEDTLLVANGPLTLGTLALMTPSGTMATAAAVTLAGKPVAGAALKVASAEATVSFPAVTIAAGQTLTVTLTVPGAVTVGDNGSGGSAPDGRMNGGDAAAAGGSNAAGAGGSNAAAAGAGGQPRISSPHTGCDCDVGGPGGHGKRGGGPLLAALLALVFGRRSSRPRVVHASSRARLTVLLRPHG